MRNNREIYAVMMMAVVLVAVVIVALVVVAVIMMAVVLVGVVLVALVLAAVYKCSWHNFTLKTSDKFEKKPPIRGMLYLIFNEEKKRLFCLKIRTICRSFM